MTKKETKKSRKNECSAIFPGQRTRILTACNIFNGFEAVIPDSAAYYQATREALLFRLPFDKKK
jgi:hypothetical protein